MTIMRRILLACAVLGGCDSEEPTATETSEYSACSLEREQVVEDCQPAWDAYTECAATEEFESRCNGDLEAFNACVYPDDGEMDPDVRSARRIAYWCDLHVDDNGEIDAALCSEQQEKSADEGVAECPLPERF